MRIMRVSFFGHREIRNIRVMENRADKLVRDVIEKADFVEFFIGRNGDFDRIIASVIKRAQKSVRDDNSALILTLPYETAELRDNRESFEEYYNDITIYEGNGRIHPKAAIGARNRYMIDISDLVIVYVKTEKGGAYSAMKYAEKQGKKVINLYRVEELYNDT